MGHILGLGKWLANELGNMEAVLLNGRFKIVLYYSTTNRKVINLL